MLVEREISTIFKCEFLRVFHHPSERPHCAPKNGNGALARIEHCPLGGAQTSSTTTLFACVS
jgi:hypothetical protein